MVPDYSLDPDRLQLFVGDYDASVRTTIIPNPYPVPATFGSRVGDQLLLHLYEPIIGWNEVWILDHVALDTFLVDVDDDGVYDLDLSFHTSQAEPEGLRWMRMRPVVGNPAGCPTNWRSTASLISGISGHVGFPDFLNPGILPR